MARKLAFAWLGGFISVYLDEGLVIEASNSRIVLGLREVTIEGLFYNYREYVMGRRRDKKLVYIDFAFPLKGISGQRPQALILSSGEFSVGPYGVVYTQLDGIEYYLTVHPPPGTLYEYAVLTTRNLALSMIGRRQVYLMDEGKVKKLILV